MIWVLSRGDLNSCFRVTSQRRREETGQKDKPRTKRQRSVLGIDAPLVELQDKEADFPYYEDALFNLSLLKKKKVLRKPTFL